MLCSVCVQLRQLPLIISFLALTVDRVHISMSLNVFLGGSLANAMRSVHPHCFLFSEHSSEENETLCRPAGSNLLQQPQTAAETRLLLLALEKSAEHHSNKPSSDPLSRGRFITQLSSVRSFVSCTDHLFRYYSFGQISLCVSVSGCNG